MALAYRVIRTDNKWKT